MTHNHTVKIASATKIEQLGVTDDLAREMWEDLGSHHIAIVDLVASEHSEDTADNRTVTLRVFSLEPASLPEVADHLRDLTRVLWRRRNPQTDIGTFDKIEPTVTDVLRDGQGVIEDAEERDSK